MDKQEQFNRIVASLYETMLDDSLWPPTAALIDQAVGMRGSHLVVAKGFDFLFQKLVYGGERREELEEWFVEVAAQDVRIPRLYDLPHGRPVPVRSQYTETELKTSFGFNEMLVRGEAQNGLDVRMDGANGLNILWVLADPTQDRRTWNSAQLTLLDHLMPHIRQFVRVRQVVADSNAMRVTLAGLLDHTGLGVLQLDRRGRIVAANASADAILRRADGLRARGRELSARLTTDHARLQKLLAAALPRYGGQGLSGSMAVRRWPEGRYALHICPVPSHDAEPAGLGLAKVATVVLIVDPAVGSRLDPERVAAVLGLTRAESEIAAALAEGLSVRDIAAATHRAESTVRWTVKRIHAKLDITRQADLVRIVLSAAVGGWRRGRRRLTFRVPTPSLPQERLFPSPQ